MTGTEKRKYFSRNCVKFFDKNEKIVLKIDAAKK